jgi:hypothetical protein
MARKGKRPATKRATVRRGAAARRAKRNSKS